MRNLVSLGLFALTLSFYSSHALASNVQACDDLKDSTKGLHGLCVAWHNASEKNKAKFEAKFLAIAGYSLTEYLNGGPNTQQPEPAVECPCWTTESLVDATAAFEGGFCFATASFDAAIFAGNVPQVWAGATPFVGTYENTTVTECRLQTRAAVFISETAPEQDEVCRADVQVLQNLTDSDGAYLFPPCSG
jgi:hypothetical protein